MPQQPRLEATMALHILTHESYTLRFEDLCVGTFSEMRQVQYVSTSRTYDLGRDGRGVTPGLVPPIICAGTGPNPLTKAKDDLNTVLESIKPTDIVFCFTAPVSEATEAQIKSNAMDRCPTIKSIEVYSGEQLSKLIRLHPETFENLYAGELNNLREGLALQTDSYEEFELTGLRVALTTQLHNDAQARREDIVRNLILTSLGSKPNVAVTLKSLAKQVTDSLHLPRPVNESWLAHDLTKLVERGMVCMSEDGKGFLITSLGTAEMKLRSEQGVESLVSGKEAVRNALHELLGYTLTISEFNQVWNLIQSEITSLFISHGIQLVESILAITDGAERVHKQFDLRARIKEIATKLIGGSTAGNRPREIAQAVEDLFHERTSPAFLWLSDLAEVFLQLCALGLEPHSQNQILARLKEIVLILDSDIVLSLISNGEPNHLAIQSMVKAWRTVGGEMFVAPAVLEEVSHHAWISENDFSSVRDIIDGMNDAGASQLIGNVFVRGFRAESKADGQKCTSRRWGVFISAFRGRHDHDYSKVLSMLRDDYGIQLLSEEPSDKAQSEEIATRLFDERKMNIGSNAHSIDALHQKCDRDGRMSTLLFRHRRVIEQDGRTAVIVSSSHSVRNAIEKANVGIERTDAVWYSTAVLWLLSQNPGVRITASSLQAVMFDVDFPIRLDPLERKAMRLFCATDEYRIHHSRRGTLRDSLRRNLFKRATETGMELHAVREQFLHDETDDGIAKSVLSAAIDEIGRSRSEDRIAELEEALAREKERANALQMRQRRQSK